MAAGSSRSAVPASAAATGVGEFQRPVFDGGSDCSLFGITEGPVFVSVIDGEGFIEFRHMRGDVLALRLFVLRRRACSFAGTAGRADLERAIVNGLGYRGQFCGIEFGVFVSVVGSESGEAFAEVLHHFRRIRALVAPVTSGAAGPVLTEDEGKGGSQ